MKKYVFRYLPVAVLIFSFLVSGCGLTLLSDKPEISRENQGILDFDTFAMDSAILMFTESEITLQAFLRNRADYGIEEAESYWGNMSLEGIESGYDEMQRIYEHLQTFNYDELSSEQQGTYDLYYTYLHGELRVRDYYLLEEIFGFQLGTHVMIPFNLSLYRIENREDIDRYLNIVMDTERYLKECTEFQKARSEAGYFMNDDYAMGVIEECQEIIDDAEIIFAEDFEALVNAAEWLTQDEKEAYISLNARYINEYIIPSYEDLIDTLESLIGTGIEGMGLHRFDGGREYYARLVQQSAGTNRSVDEIFNMLSNQIDQWDIELDNLMPSRDHSSLFDQIGDYSSPESIINNNMEQMEGRFPTIDGLEGDYYNVSYLPSFVEGTVGGLYFTTAIDDPMINNIYYSRSSSGYEFYRVISHEAVPGHLYQMVYMLSSDVSNIELRYYLKAFGEALSTLEGWTTYIEGVTSEMAGLSESQALYLSIFYNQLYAALSCIDIGIHYYGWDKQDVNEFMISKGLDDTLNIDNYLYQLIDTNPTAYLSYVIGYIDLTEMLYRAQTELGEAYSEYDFHEFYLDHSALTMDMIKELFEDWLEEQKAMHEEETDRVA